jgi:hypothetical protein
MRYNSLDKARIVYNFETSQDTLAKFVESTTVTGSTIYLWRKDWGIKKKRGHAANIKKAEELVAKYSDQAAGSPLEQATVADEHPANQAAVVAKQGARKHSIAADASAAHVVDVKGAIVFLKHAAECMGDKRPIELDDQDLMTLHALRALLGKGRV